MLNVTALVSRVIGMFRAPEDTMREHVQPVPPWTTVLGQHVLPLIIISTLAAALLSTVVTIPMLGITGPEPLDRVLLAAGIGVVVSCVMFIVQAGLAALISQFLGGSGNYNAAFVLVGLSMTPMIISEALLFVPVFGLFVVFGFIIYSFMLLYRTAPIALGLPRENRGTHLVLFILSSLVVGLLVQNVLGGPAADIGSTPA